MRETIGTPRQASTAIRSLDYRARPAGRRLRPPPEPFSFSGQDRTSWADLWKFVTGELVFLPFLLFLMSGVAVTLVIWRLLLNNSAKTNMNIFLPRFQEELEKKGIDAALRFCRSQTGMIPRKLYVAGLETSKQGLAAMRRSMANVIELEILPDLNFLLPMILAIAVDHDHGGQDYWERS